MLHPVGPLPAPVYWRRRALAFAVVVVVLLLVWAVLPGGGRTARDTAAAVGSPTPSAPRRPRRPAAYAAGRRPQRLRTASARPAGTGDRDPKPGAATRQPPKPAPAPKPCSDKALRLRVLPEPRRRTRWGRQPVLDLVVRNVSTVAACATWAPRTQEVLLYDVRNRRLWSSNDCYPGGTRDPQVLGPGDSASFSVTWSGLSSRPECAGERVRVGPGGYTLLGRLGTLTSKRRRSG